LLAHFVRNETNKEIRSAAAIRQTIYLDQPALARMAVEYQENFGVCMAAVHAITDPDMLAKVVEELCEKGFYFTNVMNTAVDKIADQGLWARMAVDEGCRPIREEIVARLTNQDVLTEIAEKDTKPKVRRAAAERLENPDIKARIMSQLMAQFVAEEVVGARNDRARAAALLEVDCEPLIRVLARKEKNTRMRATAILLLTDQNERKRLATLDPQPMMRQAAVAGVEDEAFLLNRADRDDAIMVRKTAVNAMRDSQTLVQAATMAYDDQVRQWALAILERRNEKDLIARAKAAQGRMQERMRAMHATSEKNLLMKAALHGETRMICHTAIARLKDDADLKRIVVESSDPEAAGMALDEIRDPKIWAEIAENAAVNPAVRMIAVVKTGRFSWREVLRAAMNDVQALNVAAAAVRWTATGREAAKAAVSEVCRELLCVGDESRIPELMDLLSLCGEKSLAEDYLNSGHPDLNDAAVDWARERGYQISPGSGSNRAAWGTR
jgi:hypothetical protein